MLQYRKMIFVLAFIFSSLLHAESIAPVSGDSHGCEVSVSEAKKVKAAILKCKNIDFKKEQEFLDSKFIRWQTIPSSGDTWIALFFTNGVHGEEVVIFSKNQQKKVKEVRSSWPIEIEKASKNVMRVVYRVDSDENGDYPPIFHELK